MKKQADGYNSKLWEKSHDKIDGYGIIGVKRMKANTASSSFEYGCCQ